MGLATGIQYRRHVQRAAGTRVPSGADRNEPGINRAKLPLDRRFRRVRSFLNAMAAVHAAKKAALTIPPTVRTLPSGVPTAPLLNLAARAPASSHGHDHGHAGPRGDLPPRWAGGVSRTSSGLVSTTYLTCMSFFFLTLEFL